MKKLVKLHEGCTSNIRPATFEDLCDGEGGYNYNHNIRTINVEIGEHGEVEVSEPTDTSEVRYKFDRLVMTAPKTANHILSDLLSEKCPSDKEMKLVNDYNAAKLSLYGGSTTSTEAKENVNAYKEYLENRIALKLMVDTDCDSANIPQN